MFEYLLFDRFFFLTLITLLIIFLLTKYYKTFNLEIFLDDNYNKIQSFHCKPALNIGGLIIVIFFFLSLLFFNYKSLLFLKSFDKLLINLFISILIIFFFSVLEDLKINFAPSYRLILLFLITSLLVVFNKLEIYSTQFYTLDNLIRNNYLFSVFFTSICILLIINGSNFIDGFNGLLAIQAIIITFIITIINFYFNNINLLILCYLFLIILCIFLFFNFPKSKIFFGNSGSYIVGFIISFLVLKTSQQTQYHKVYPFFFAILLYYLFFEVIFSFFRKLLYENRNPLLPDKKHLHMLLYYKLKSNPKNSLILNFYFFISIVPAFFFLRLPGFLKFYFILLLIGYICLYVKLLKYAKKIK